MPTTNNQVIKKPVPKYYHCFKLSDSSYALFDSKVDMPLIIGSISLIQSTKLPQNSFVFYYEINSQFFFNKPPKNYLDMNTDATNVRQKPALRYHYIDPKGVQYHMFKLNSVLWSLFDIEFDMPLAYGSLSKVQAVINKVNETSVIYYYHEDVSVKNSFKVWYVYKNKKIEYLG